MAHVGTMPDCRQAHYLSLAKKTHYTKNTLTKRESIYLLPDLERVPIAFHVARHAHTHHGVPQIECSIVVDGV